MDPATSKTCQLCNKQVYPRDVRSDGTCKSCARKQYYQSRKELLAERYRNNREHRLMKQREYYVRKKEGKVASSDGKPSTSRRRTSKKQKAQDQPSFVQSTEYDDKETNERITEHPSVIVEQGSSSSSVALPQSLEMLNGPSTVVKIAYPGIPVTTSSFIIGPDGTQPQIITWEMLQQGQLHQNGIERPL